MKRTLHGFRAPPRSSRPAPRLRRGRGSSPTLATVGSAAPRTQARSSPSGPTSAKTWPAKVCWFMEAPGSRTPYERRPPSVVTHSTPRRSRVSLTMIRRVSAPRPRLRCGARPERTSPSKIAASRAPGSTWRASLAPGVHLRIRPSSRRRSTSPPWIPAARSGPRPPGSARTGIEIRCTATSASGSITSMRRSSPRPVNRQSRCPSSQEPSKVSPGEIRAKRPRSSAARW